MYIRRLAPAGLRHEGCLLKGGHLHGVILKAPLVEAVVGAEKARRTGKAGPRVGEVVGGNLLGVQNINPKTALINLQIL